MAERWITQGIARVNVPIEWVLLSVHIFVVTLLIVLWRVEILPIAQVGTFLFASVLAFLFALYRPRWALWFTVGLLPLEAINIAPEVFGIAVRPYQFLGVALLGAIAVRALTSRPVRRMFRWQWWDSAVILFIASGFVAALFARDASGAFAQAFIATSFGVWYFLMRYFVRGPVTARMPLTFFLVSSAIVVLYGIVQSWQSAHGIHDSVVMQARPNATFPEPDWFGIFLVFVSALIYGTFFALYARYRTWRIREWFVRARVSALLLFALLISVDSVLLATVARSAWLGAFVLTLCVVAVFGLRYGLRGARGVVSIAIVAGIVAYGVGIAVPLTTFDLANRLQSTHSGMQEITVACQTQSGADAVRMRGVIADTAELAPLACWHINLEEQDALRAEGAVITHILRPDPSRNVRREIYTKVFALLRTEWRVALFGVGWGQASLGEDANGQKLNTSNLFLETWIGSGIMGLGALCALIGNIVWRACRTLRAGGVVRSVRIYGVYAFLGAIAIMIPNMFNAGIFLGFLWFFLGMMAGLRKV